MNETQARAILAKTQQLYDTIADEFSASRRHMWHDLDTALPYVPTEENGHTANITVADIGCGNGRLLTWLPEALGNDHLSNYTGIDTSEKLLEKARAQHPSQTFINGSILDIPLPSDHADVTFCIATLHHIPSKQLRQKAIAELTRITKPGGIIIVSVWYLWRLAYAKNILRALMQKLRGAPTALSDFSIPWSTSGERYVHAFTKRELAKELNPIGTIMRCDYTSGGKSGHTPRTRQNILAICKKT